MTSGLVVEIDSATTHYRNHEYASRAWVAGALASLLGYGHVSVPDRARHCTSRKYFVPGDTLLAEEAAALNIRSQADLFGGVVPHAFVRTKSITHPLAGPDASAPAGWSRELGEALGDAVLKGYAAFTCKDARRAAQKALENGPARVKLSSRKGGLGQAVIKSVQEIEALLAEETEADLARDGLVVEEDLKERNTYSIGQVRVGELVATYCGTQRNTTNHEGQPVYGGSELRVARGGFEALLALDIDDDCREAVDKASRFDAATARAFAGLYHSRSNYDVLRGTDAQGRERQCVLEQSWRIGGASAAELAALILLRAKPKLKAVCAETTEVYGECAPPPGAAVIFSGEDAHAGVLQKFVEVRPA